MQPHTPVIPGLGRSKWEDHDSKAATAAQLHLRLAWAADENKMYQTKRHVHYYSNTWRRLRTEKYTNHRTNMKYILQKVSMMVHHGSTWNFP